MATVRGGREMSARPRQRRCAARAPAAAQRARRRRAGPRAHVLRPSGPLLPFALARGIAFFALAAFGALHWMAMLEPAAAGARLVRGRRRRCSRWPALLGRRAAARRGRAGSPSPRSASAALVLAFLAAGVADELLRPDQLGRAGRRHRRAASTRCPARACPTAASTSGPGS